MINYSFILLCNSFCIVFQCFVSFFICKNAQKVVAKIRFFFVLFKFSLSIFLFFVVIN